MTVTELTVEELGFLLIYARLIAFADGQTSVEELDLLDRLRNDVGPAYSHARRLEGPNPMGTDQALELARSIQRPKARAFIIDWLGALAQSDGEVAQESDLLARLQSVWS